MQDTRSANSPELTSPTSLPALCVAVLAFWIALRLGRNLLTAQTLACLAATLFDFIAARRRNRPFPAAQYLTLTTVWGTASYLLIWLIFSIVQSRATPIKIAVEALLLLAGMALRRAASFVPNEPDRDEDPLPFRPASKALAALLWLLLLVPLAVEYYGFRITRILHETRWLPEGEIRFRNYTLVFLVIAFAGLFARRWLLPALAAAVLACTVYAAGIAPPAAVLLFVFSATVSGRLLLRSSLGSTGEGGSAADGEPAVEGPLAFLTGTAAWIVVMYAAATLPIHYPAVYVAALALPVAAGYRQTRLLASEWLAFLRPARLPSPAEHLATAGLAFIVLANWLTALKPEASTDGLAVHLNIAAGMALRHAYTVDFHRIVWALMPIGADFCYAVLYSLGGEYGARLLNFTMLVTVATLIVCGARRFVSRPVAMLLAAMFVSTPMVYMVSGSLLVENFVAAMVLGSLMALWRFHETRATRYLMMTGILFGTSISLKIGAMAAGLIGLACVIAEVRRRNAAVPLKASPRITAAAMLLLLAIGSVPYVKAWRLTGNPLYPFAVGFIKSSQTSGPAIADTRYNHPLTWHTLFDLTFRTNLYHEGQPGALGFAWFLFLPLIVAAFFAWRSAPNRSFQARTAIVIGGVSAFIVAASQPNARYFYFALPPLVLGAAAALAWLRARNQNVFRAAVLTVLCTCYCNVWFLPVADWYHRGFYSTPLFSAEGRDDYLRHGDGSQGQIRKVNEWINGHNTTHPVVFTDDSETVGLIAPAYANNWHDYNFTLQVEASPLPLDVYRLFSRYGIAEMVVDTGNQHRQAALNGLISVCGVVEFVADPFIAMKLRPDCEQAIRATPVTSAVCTPGEPLPRGTHDESDPRVVFAGSWEHAVKFAEPYSHTIAFSNVPGASVCFAINGTGFDYIHAMAYNRGRAEILVDGKPRAHFDLYDPAIVWQAHTPLRGLAPGRHVITIQALPEKTAASSDFYIDLDAVTVY